MAKLDPFLAQIVNWVRSMPDDALLDLVRNRLGGSSGSSFTVAAPVGFKAAPANGRRGPRRKRRRRATSADREQYLLAVERAIKSSKGLSASEIVARTKLPKPRVQQAVRELKAAKRIFQGGDRRFARYAGDARTAKQASIEARKNVAGPRKKK